MIESPSATNPAHYPKKLVILLCVCANILFLVASPVSFFASTLQRSKTPTEDDSPYYGFLYFCSFGTAAFSIIAVSGVSKAFYKLVESPVEPGELHSRYNKIWTAFVLSVIVTLVFAATSAYLSFLWTWGAQYFGGFWVTSLLACLAALSDVVVACSISLDFVVERQFFIRAASPKDEVEGLLLN